MTMNMYKKVTVLLIYFGMCFATWLLLRMAAKKTNCICSLFKWMFCSTRSFGPECVTQWLRTNELHYSEELDSDIGRLAIPAGTLYNCGVLPVRGHQPMLCVRLLRPTKYIYSTGLHIEIPENTQKRNMRFNQSKQHSYSVTCHIVLYPDFLPGV